MRECVDISLLIQRYLGFDGCVMLFDSIMNRQIKLQSESVSVCVFDRVSHFKKRCLHYLMAELRFAEYNYVFRRSARAIVIGDHGSLTLVCVDRDVCV